MSVKSPKSVAQTWLDKAREAFPTGLGGTEVEWDETTDSLSDFVGLEHRLAMAEVRS